MDTTISFGFPESEGGPSKTLRFYADKEHLQDVQGMIDALWSLGGQVNNVLVSRLSAKLVKRRGLLFWRPPMERLEVTVHYSVNPKEGG